MTQDSEKKLIRDIKLSNEGAFKELCRIYYESMYKFIWCKINNNEDAFDLVQELFLNIWKNRNNLNEDKSIKSYLYKSSLNLCINYLKKSAKVQHLSIDSKNNEIISRDTEQQNWNEDVDDILQDIPEIQKTVFRMNRFDGLKYTEIAEIFKISVKTVESYMSKTLKVLRDRMKHLLVLLLIFFELV